MNFLSPTTSTTAVCVSVSDKGSFQNGVFSLLMTQPLSHLVMYISSPRKTLMHQSHQLDIDIFRLSALSRVRDQQVLTLDTCGLTLFRIISRHSAASPCWWTAERVRRWFWCDCSEILLCEPLTIFNLQPLCDAARLTRAHFHLVEDVSQLPVNAACCALQPFKYKQVFTWKINNSELT